MEIKRKRNNSSKVLDIINTFLSFTDIHQGTEKTISSICELYDIDRACLYIKNPTTGNFTIAFEYTLENAGTEYMRASDFDVSDRNLFKSATNSTGDKAIISILKSKKFIQTNNYDSIEPMLNSLGYKNPNSSDIEDFLIFGMGGNSVDIIGYYTFERYGDMNKFDKTQISEIQSMCEIFNNRIENYEMNKQIIEDEQQNTFDPLTGLNTLRKFKTTAEMLIKKNKSYALVSFDIDKFKYINDIWGFDIGDKILVEIANVVSSFISSNELCCRSGDDRFALLLKYVDEQKLRMTLAEIDSKFVAVQQEKFKDIKITVIAGVYIVQPQTHINLIIDKANIAKNSVKGSYKNTYEIYNQSIENVSEREKELEKRMISALENDQFIPYLQPKFFLDTNTICGCEALARWEAEDRIIFPEEFIPVFEQNGFITKLDFLMYEKVFKAIRNWLDKGYTVLPISLNVSRGHIVNTDFLPNLMYLINQYNVPIDLIELELTESAFNEDKVILKNFISRIRQAHIKVSIDDFGTAYSSLNLLKNVEVDIIKMDKGFIDDICNEDNPELVRRDKVIIKNIIEMINELHFDVIFEGIERKEQVEFLKELNCKYGQGFIFSKPIHMDEFEAKYLKV